MADCVNNYFITENPLWSFLTKIYSRFGSNFYYKIYAESYFIFENALALEDLVNRLQILKRANFFTDFSVEIRKKTWHLFLTSLDRVYTILKQLIQELWVYKVLLVVLPLLI